MNHKFLLIEIVLHLLFVSPKDREKIYCRGVPQLFFRRFYDRVKRNFLLHTCVYYKSEFVEKVYSNILHDYGSALLIDEIDISHCKSVKPLN